MHFEFLIEDQSGKYMLETLVPKILGEQGKPHTWRILSYKGIGHIPQGLRGQTDPRKRILLDQLPRILGGYSKTYAHMPGQYAIFVICDLDDRCLVAFRQELDELSHACNSHPSTRFCIAIEEGEAWLLGDSEAIRKVYPDVKSGVLDAYTYDSICGTWELLADAVYAGGARALKARGWQAIGAQKSIWAATIAPSIDVERNNSPSFQYFRKKIRELAIED
jgi:hypothetical protein